MKARQILKYTLPAAAPLGIVAISVALTHVRTLPSHLSSTEVETGHQTASSTNSATDPSVSVTINGQSVPVDPNSTTQFDTGNGQATVEVSGNSQNTSTVGPDGNVTVTVSSSSTNSNSTTFTQISGFSGAKFTNNSSVRVHTNGTGNVSVSN